MPAATLAEITKWVKQAQDEGASYLIIVCDTFDWGDYPITVMPDQDFLTEFDRVNGRNMQQIMEIYDLSHDIETQLGERRSWHPPQEGIFLRQRDHRGIVIRTGNLGGDSCNTQSKR